MQRIVCNAKIYKYHLLFSFIGIIWTLIAEPSDWRMDSLFKLVFYLLSKCLFIFIVWNIVNLVIWYFWIQKEDALFAKRLLIVASILLTLYITLLIIFWPGIYNTDGVYIYTLTRLQYQGATSQGFFTVLFYLVAMSIWAHPVSIILLQIFLCITFFLFLYYKLRGILKSEWAVLSCIPAFFPSVILYTLVPMRAFLFSCLFCLCLINVLEIYYDRMEGRTLPLRKVVIISLEIAMLAIWRFEAIPFIILIPIAVGIIFKNIKYMFNIFLWALALMILFKIPISLDNSSGMELSGRIVMINPLSCMLQVPLKGHNIEKNLEKIDQFVSIENLKNNPNPESDSISYLIPGTLKYDSKQSIIHGLVAYADIILHNPLEFIEARMTTFGLTEKNIFKFSPTNEFTADGVKKSAYLGKTSISEEKIVFNINEQLQPLHPQLRIKVTEVFYNLRVFWSNSILIVGLLIILLSSLILKKKRLIFQIETLLIISYFILVWATIPNTWYMYWLPVNLASWELIIIYVIYIFRHWHISKAN